MAYRIAKAKTPFTIGEEWIFPSTKDICCEILVEAAVQKIEHVPLSASTVTGRIEEIAEDIDTQMFERIDPSPWYSMQVDESRDIANKAMLLVYVHGIYYVRYLCHPTQREHKVSCHWMAKYLDN